MIQSVNITAPNGTDTFFVDGTLNQCSYYSAESVVILRTTPLIAGLYEGEVFNIGDTIYAIEKAPVTLQQRNIPEVYLTITNPATSETWTAAEGITGGTADIRILRADFTPGDSLTVTANDTTYGLASDRAAVIEYTELEDPQGNTFTDPEDNDIITIP